jgi:protein required for attachment to host cells
MTTWVIVADSSRARIFAAATPLGPLQELETLAHPAGRLHAQDLTSDLPGRAFDSVGDGRHAMGQPVEPKEEEALRFARQIAERLDTGRKEGRYDKAVIVAAPKFLGYLRQCQSAPVTALIVAEIAKDLTRHMPEEIRAQVPERL